MTPRGSASSLLTGTSWPGDTARTVASGLAGSEAPSGACVFGNRPRAQPSLDTKSSLGETSRSEPAFGRLSPPVTATVQEGIALCTGLTGNGDARGGLPVQSGVPGTCRENSEAHEGRGREQGY